MLIFDIDDRSGSGFAEACGGAMRLAALAVLDIETYVLPCGIGAAIVGDEEIRRMNRVYRGIDRATDVLSFAAEPDETPGPGAAYLGDIVISADRAREQAAAYGHTLEREAAFLTAHSVLHLLGYDHETPGGEREMFAKQEAALVRAGFARNIDNG